ncbi:glutathione s-transferase [Moniliophthora roreri MCA 2997]|uniref:Glutathione s-transferase n=2 Tax=Moniliophthora roreri TaxID=221103 RepID=V2XHW3_MONRO|nr:glutathione s-transferase [Moniliophthora roreri MCA 2997]
MSTSRDVSNQSDISKSKYHDEDGSFKRAPSSFRDVIEKGGKFEPAKDRYHLYVSYACPWATRTLIVRKIKGLEDIISVSVVSPRMGDKGWPFATADDFPGTDADPLYNSQHVKDLYLRCSPEYSGRFTVPVLWDKQTHTIVNNESSEIIRTLNTAFNDFIPPEKAQIDLYPQNLRAEIDAVNEWVYPDINNGVYRSGFATTQGAYETAVKQLFASLDRVEEILKSNEYLVGGQLTEADVRAWVTMIRFDPVYVGHFKCNIRNIRNGYPAINKWMKKLYWNHDAFKSSTNFEHIKTHYYWSHPHINPTRVVPVGPVPDIEPL